MSGFWWRPVYLLSIEKATESFWQRKSYDTAFWFLRGQICFIIMWGYYIGYYIPSRIRLYSNNTWLSAMNYVANGFSRRAQAGAVNPSWGRDRFTFVRAESKGEESRRHNEEATMSGKNGARKCLDICYLPRPLEIINPVKSTKSYLSWRDSCLRRALRGWRGKRRRRGRKERRRRRRGQREGDLDLGS